MTTKRRRTLKERMAEVRRRVIVDYNTSTASDSPQFSACLICNWCWNRGEPEMHEPGCPIQEEKA